LLSRLRGMNREDAVAFARRWTDAWNKRDLDAILAHFEDDVTFSSPRAVDAVGSPTVHGKSLLRHYWATAIQSITCLRFTLLRVVWDPRDCELAIVYDRLIDGRRDRACEVLRFGPSGLVVRGEVFYGVVPYATSSASP
jgi:ketosteroid isomerase-like protein